MIEELQAKLIQLEQKLISHEQEDLRIHARFNEKLRDKADKDDIQQLRLDLKDDFHERDVIIKENKHSIIELNTNLRLAKMAMGMMITLLGAIGYALSWAVDRWDKIKGYF